MYIYFHVQRNTDLPKAPYLLHPLVGIHHFGIQDNTGYPVNHREQKMNMSCMTRILKTHVM